MKVRVAIVIMFSLAFPALSLAADIDLYTDNMSGIEPNVLVLLDTSESMSEDASSAGLYDPGLTYPGIYSTGVVHYKIGNSWDNIFRNSTAEIVCSQARTALETEGFYSGKIDAATAGCDGNKNYFLRAGNYLNYLSTPDSGMRPRLGIATGTLQSYINTTYDVRFGAMIFNDDNEKDEGGMLLKDVMDMIPTNRSALHSAIGGLQAQTWSPLAEALYEAGLYFQGGASSFNPGVTYTSPIQYWCQRNYIILVSDGVSTRDRDPVLTTIGSSGDTDGDGAEPGTFVDTDPSDDHLIDGDLTEGSDYLDDVAKYLYDTDLRPDLDDNQNLVTYTIGFTPTNALLQDTAGNGRGKYFYVHNAQSFAAALQAIIEEILSQSTSYMAPVVPISHMEKTTSGDSIYLALFKSSGRAFWKGNIKKFSLATQDDPSLGISKGDILDVNGNRATDENGYILDTAASFWGGGSPDGGETETGGVGKLLLNRPTLRNIYSWIDLNERPLTHPSNAFLKANPKLTAAMLQAKDSMEREKIINFVHGYDAYDEDGDLNTTEKRSWILGAFLHSRPCVVHYDSSTSVIFAGANDGMLHAVLDSDGSELWAFIPPNLLDKLKLLSGDNLEYFADGSPTAAVIDNNMNGVIEPEAPENDRVIVISGERRGGTHYYALDVTDPLSPQYLWEVSPEDPVFSEIGQTWGTPVFGRILYGNQLAVFLNGGYDPDQDDDPTEGDTVGRGVYVIELLTGMLIKKFTYQENPDMVWSIPSDIAVVDTTDNGFIDRAYVGDTGGRLWRFDLASADPVAWSAQILFEANSPTNEGRKFFYPPDVLLEQGYEILVFGTGDRANPNKNTVINRIYGVKDKGTGTTLDESYLIDVTDDLLQDPYTSEAEKAALRTELENGYGWYIRLADNPGEKVLAPPLTLFGTAYVTTHTPAQLPLADPCSGQYGTARLYALNYKTAEATLNLDTANDGDSEVLERSDRSLIVGESIPSMMVIALIGKDAAGFIGVGGGIFKTPVSMYLPLISMYWRFVF